MNIRIKEEVARDILRDGATDELIFHLRTNCGSRILALPSLAETITLTDLEEKKREDSERLERLERAADRIRDQFANLNDLLWVVSEPLPYFDGPEPASPVAEFPKIGRWHLALADPQQEMVAEVGLVDEDQITAREELTRAADGQLVGQFWELARDDEPPALAMKATARGNGSVRTEGLRVVAAHYVGLASIVVEKPILGHQLWEYAGVPILVVRISQGALFYDLSQPAQPRLLQQPPRTTQRFGDHFSKMANWSPQQSRERLLAHVPPNIAIVDKKDLAVLADHDKGMCLIYMTSDRLIKGR